MSKPKNKLRNRYKLAYINKKTNQKGYIKIGGDVATDISNIDYFTTKLGSKNKVLSFAEEVIDLENTELYIEYQQSGTKQTRVVYDNKDIQKFSEKVKTLRESATSASEVARTLNNDDSLIEFVRKITQDKVINQKGYLTAMKDSFNISERLYELIKDLSNTTYALNDYYLGHYSRYELSGFEESQRALVVKELTNYRSLRDLINFNDDFKNKKEHQTVWDVEKSYLVKLQQTNKTSYKKPRYTLSDNNEEEVLYLDGEIYESIEDGAGYYETIIDGKKVEKEYPMNDEIDYEEHVK
jgi:hypothetical protein